MLTDKQTDMDFLFCFSNNSRMASAHFRPNVSSAFFCLFFYFLLLLKHIKSLSVAKVYSNEEVEAGFEYEYEKYVSTWDD